MEGSSQPILHPEALPLFLLPLAVTRVESGGHVNVQLNILTKVRHSHKCGKCA